MTTANSENSDIFFSIEDVLSERLATHAEIASAIEIFGIEAFDCFQRFVVLSNESPTAAGVSIEEALIHLQRNLQSICDDIYNNCHREEPELDHEYWRREAECLKVCVYGWRKRKLPDFQEAYKKWSEATSNIKPDQIPVVRPANQSKLNQLLRALIELNYGREKADSLDDERCPLIRELQRDLELKNYSFDQKTLRRWLKGTEKK